MALVDLMALYHQLLLEVRVDRTHLMSLEDRLAQLVRLVLLDQEARRILEILMVL